MISSNLNVAQKVTTHSKAQIQMFQMKFRKLQSQRAKLLHDFPVIVIW